jgi:hypothetical protein
MISVSINNNLSDLANRLKSLNTDIMLREVAEEVKDRIIKRVHQQGLDADGTPIGTYTKGYMKVRTGNYPETKITRGKNKGQFRLKKEKKGQAGYFTKGNNKGKERPRYNLPNDSKVILALTGQMQKYMQVIKTDNGYGIGYSNELNYNKAIWNEKRYKKDIWSLSVEELNVMESIAERYINNGLND